MRASTCVGVCIFICALLPVCMCDSVRACVFVCVVRVLNVCVRVRKQGKLFLLCLSVCVGSRIMLALWFGCCCVWLVGLAVVAQPPRRARARHHRNPCHHLFSLLNSCAENSRAVAMVKNG